MLRLFTIAMAVIALTGTEAPQEQQASQEPPGQQKGQVSHDFFSGTVVSLKRDQVSVSRSQETRSFRIDKDTKIEGRLVMNAKVTVGYASTTNGDIATRIIVRSEQERKP